MSKIHQAIRRAEREGRQAVLSGRAVTPRDVLSEIKQELLTPTPGSAEDEPQNRVNRADPGTPFGEKLSEFRSQSLSSDARLVAFNSPRSYASEQYRALKTKLYQMREKGRLQTILVTSAAPGEGKTLTSVNLALTIAQEINQRVLLVDADLRRPNVHHTLGLPQRAGLADMLKGDRPIDALITPTPVVGLYLLQAGSIPENPAELLNTQRMKDLLKNAADRFDWVILDSPPFLPLADTELMSTLVDGILVVVRALQTPADLISKSAQGLQGKKVLGIVFNCNQDMKHSNYYYSYHYDEPVNQ